MEGFLRGLLLGLGTVALPLGLFWLAQGTFHWTLVPAPPPRFGGLVAVLGVVMLWLGRRMSAARR